MISSQDSPATPRALWSRLPYYEAWQIDWKSGWKKNSDGYDKENSDNNMENIETNTRCWVTMVVPVFSQSVEQMFDLLSSIIGTFWCY